MDTKEKALVAVKRFSFLAGVAALSPFPVTDVAGVGGVQFAMLIKLAKIYGYESDIMMLKDTIIAGLGGVVTQKILQWGASLVKSIPVVGTVIGEIIQAPLAFVTTYSIGRTFIKFFEEKVDIKKITKDEVRKTYESFIPEAKKGCSISIIKQMKEQSESEELVNKNLNEVRELLKPFSKFKEIFVEVMQEFKRLAEAAKETKKLGEELKKVGEELKGGEHGE